MSKVWIDILGCGDIQDSDTFFDLGGDSVMAMSLVFQIEEQFGLTAEVFEVFDHPGFSDFLNRMNSLAIVAA
jgi:fengycin family lipopeptide synthetase D